MRSETAMPSLCRKRREREKIVTLKGKRPQAQCPRPWLRYRLSISFSAHFTHITKRPHSHYKPPEENYFRPYPVKGTNLSLFANFFFFSFIIPVQSSHWNCNPTQRKPPFPSFLPLSLSIERSKGGKGERRGRSTPDRSSASATTTTAPVVYTWVNGPLSLGAKSGLSPLLSLYCGTPPPHPFYCYIFFFSFCHSLFLLRRRADTMPMDNKDWCIVD